MEIPDILYKIMNGITLCFFVGVMVYTVWAGRIERKKREAQADRLQKFRGEQR